MKISAFITTMLLSLSLSAQESPDRVKFNSSQENGYQKGYLYPGFQDGKVFLKDGSHGAAKMNFNGLTSEMLFISPKNDTLKLARPEATLMVTVATDTFCFHEKTFLKKVTHYADAPNLFVSPDLKFVTVERAVPYGYSATTATASYNASMNTGGTMTDLSEDRNMIFSRSKEMFVRNEKGSFLPVKQAVFYNMAPDAKNSIKAFVDAERISLKDRKDVIKLIDYMHALKTAEKQEAGKD